MCVPLSCEYWQIALVLFAWPLQCALLFGPPVLPLLLLASQCQHGAAAAAFPSEPLRPKSCVRIGPGRPIDLARRARYGWRQ